MMTVRKKRGKRKYRLSAHYSYDQKKTLLHLRFEHGNTLTLLSVFLLGRLLRRIFGTKLQLSKDLKTWFKYNTVHAALIYIILKSRTVRFRSDTDHIV